MYGYIYLIVNNINGKTYVGKRKLYNKNWNEDGYMGSGHYLRRSQNKYGIENFEKFLITWTYSEEDACEKEKFWIAEYRKRGKAEYNVADGGQGGLIGTWTEERRKKMSESKKGSHYKGSPRSEEAKMNISEAHKGIHPSEETRKKMSEAHKGHKAWNKGKKGLVSLSEKAKMKISESHKGMKFSEEHKRKLSELHKGRKWYTNGTESVQAFECPDGFVPGRDKIKLEK